ncbi:MAG: ABC transporter permease [Acidimicrobiales bacterium]
MRAVLTIARKDLRLRVRDRSAFIIGVVAPFVLAFILNLVFGGVGGDEFSATFGVVDRDGGPVAASLTEVVEGLGGDIEVETDLGDDEARQKIDDDDLDAAFVIPEGFSAAAQTTEPTEIQVIGNVDSQISTQVATAVAERFASNLNAARLAVAVTGAADPAEAAALGQEAAAAPDPITVGTIEAERRQLDTTTYFIGGLSVFFLFFLVQFGVTGLLEEQQVGTMARLLAAPIPRLAIPAAKALGSFVMGIASMTVLAVASTVLMGADWGDPVGAGILIMAGVLASVGIMAVVTGVARTAEQAGNTGAIIAVILGMLGGSFFPVAQGGGLLSQVAVVTPHFWFLRGLGDMASGEGFTAALPAAAALLTFGLVVGGVGLALLHRKVAQ